MGYYYTVEAENAVPPNSCAMPKTHTPGSPVKERGLRYYNPKIGRWVSRDPMGEKVVNLYEACWNNTLRFVDPDGREPQYWPPEQGPQGSNKVFAICSRLLHPDGVIESVVYGVINSWGGQHTYLQYGSCTKCEGWGFGAGKKGSMPQGEKWFHPTDCITCKKSDGALSNGTAKGKKASEATDEEIVDCIKKTPASQDYDPKPPGMYVCKDWANEAAKKCGLDCSK